MIAIIEPSVLSGSITAPASKSVMQRACALALLAGGETILRNPGKSNDDLVALSIINALGAESTTSPEGHVHIQAKEDFCSGFSNHLYCGESGLSIRMFTPIAALCSSDITINGSGSLLKRPMQVFDEIFPSLGVSISSNKGYLPITIRGPLIPKDILVDGSLSSQFLTGLLFAFGKAVKKQVVITVTNLKSKPYIDLTLQMMKQFGFDVEHERYERFIIKPQQEKKGSPMNFHVEGDWSGAAFMLVAGAIAGGIRITGLDVFSKQADKTILQALMSTGVNLSIEENQIVINKPLQGQGKPFHINATDCPDLFPPLVALASYCNGISVIEGVNRLRYKESDRSLTLQQEFGKMGVKISLQDNLMLVEGGTPLRAATVQSHQDHRIAMACAVAALQAEGKTIIEGAEVVNKSYPEFYNDLKMLHAAVSLQAII